MSDAAAGLPDFTVEQSFVINTVAKETAREVIAELQKETCPFPCPRIEAVETVLFGRTEAGVTGLDARMAAAESTLTALVDSITWIKRMIAGASVAGGVGFAVWLTEQLIHR